MSNAYSIVHMLRLCTLLSVAAACTHLYSQSHYMKKEKTMNNHKPSQGPSTWLASIPSLKNAGSFVGKDKQGNQVMLEWQKTTLVSPDFVTAYSATWEIAEHGYTPVEMQFLQAYPEVVGKEAYFKPFEPLFASGVAAVDWRQVEVAMRSVLKGHFVLDPSLYSDAILKAYAHDIIFVVTIKDQATNQQLGFITFMVRVGYAHGDIKVMSFAVSPAHQCRGLGKLLMGAIFNIVPQVKRIFLHTRVTNERALQAYRSWGFMDDQHPVIDHPLNMAHWSCLEYKADQSNVLQKAAALLK